MQIVTNKKLCVGFVLMMIFVSAHLVTHAQTKSGKTDIQQPIFPKGRSVPASNFTGKAWVHSLIEADSAFNIPVASVTFEPGARTHWHSHAGGQALIAIDGIGYYQEKGKPIQILRKGDSIKCPPDTEHWHGASPEAGFVQIAVTPNTARGRVVWLRPVTDEEYAGVRR